MNPEASDDLNRDQPQPLLPWHKPEIQRLVVKVDTGDAPGSGTDLETNGLNFISDIRVKQGIAGISNALAGVLALHGDHDLEQMYPEIVARRKDGSRVMNYALLVPVLVEAIKQQQAMIEDLQDQVKELH